MDQQAEKEATHKHKAKSGHCHHGPCEASDIIHTGFLFFFYPREPQQKALATPQKNTTVHSLAPRLTWAKNTKTSNIDLSIKRIDLAMQFRSAPSCGRCVCCPAAGATCGCEAWEWVAPGTERWGSGSRRRGAVIIGRKRRWNQSITIAASAGNGSRSCISFDGVWFKEWVEALVGPGFFASIFVVRDLRSSSQIKCTDWGKL